MASKRELSSILGKPQNYAAQEAAIFVTHDLIDIRLHLIRIVGHHDLDARLKDMILSFWRDEA